MIRNDDDRPDLPEPGDATLDAAVRAARRSPSADESVAATRRAWSLIEGELHAPSATSPACDAARAELGAFVAGRLSPERNELVADHCRECASCRRELLVLRDGPVAPTRAPVVAPSRARRLMRRVLPAALAAAAAAGVVTAAYISLRGAGRAAHVAELDGQLVLTSGGSSELAVGGVIPAGAAVRTAKGSRAILELPDGSRVEMNERAELRFSEQGRALTVDLDRGDIIVVAAKRKERNLFVRTDDCSVAVKGTVFTVGHGLKGSRVGVLEGEVHVDEGGDQHVLKPGDQVATSADLGAESLEEQVEWSLTRDRWTTLLHEVDAAAAQVEQEGIPPAVRYESEILDAMPAGTVFYAALPNSGGLARFAELVGARIADNQQLAQWWQSQVEQSARGGEPSLAGMLDEVARLSSAVGDEVVLAFVLPQGASDAALDAASVPLPVLVTRVADEGALRDALARLPSPGDRAGTDALLVPLADLRAKSATGRHEVAFVLHADHVLVGPSTEAITAVATSLGSATPASTPFLDALRDQYREGAEVVVAADLAAIVDRSMAAHASRAAASDVDGFARAMSAVGLDGIDRFMLTMGHDDPGSATLTFRDDRHGMASWLAEPAPMGSLDFVSPKASIVVSSVFRDPRALLEEIDGRIGPQGLSDGIARFEAETGIDLLDDVAAPLGGEMTVAIDGPFLPTPSWKVVVEVYDEDRLEKSIEQLVLRAQEWSRDGERAAGELRPEVSLDVEQTTEGPARVLALDAKRIHYAFRDGYLVACPSQQLLVAALETQRLGSIADSAKLRALLPKGADHVSLLAYEDLGAIVGELGSSGVGQLLPAQAQAFAQGGPLMLHARASDRAITFGLGSASGGPGAQLASLVRQAVVHSLAARAADEAQAAAPGSAPDPTAVGYDAAPGRGDGRRSR